MGIQFKNVRQSDPISFVLLVTEIPSMKIHIELIIVLHNLIADIIEFKPVQFF